MSAARESLEITVRPMRRADLVEIDRIERLTYPYPWSMGIFRDCLQTGYLCRVLDTPEGLAGYAVVSVGAGEAHLLNLCISPDRRGARLGTLFLERVLTEARATRASRIILEVRPSNLAAQRLYERAGFTQIGIRPGYYPGPAGREDALVLARLLDGDGGPV